MDPNNWISQIFKYAHKYTRISTTIKGQERDTRTTALTGPSSRKHKIHSSAQLKIKTKILCIYRKIRDE